MSMRCIECGSLLAVIHSQNIINSVILDKDGSQICICNKCGETYNIYSGHYVSHQNHQKKIKLTLKSGINKSFLDVIIPENLNTFISNIDEKDLIYIASNRDNQDKLYIYNYGNMSFYKDGDIILPYSITKPSLITISMWSFSLALGFVLAANSYAFAHIHAYANTYMIFRIFAMIPIIYFLTNFVSKIFHRLLVPQYYMNVKEYSNIYMFVNGFQDVLAKADDKTIQKLIDSNNKLIDNIKIIFGDEKNASALIEQNQILSNFNDKVSVENLKKLNKDLVDTQIKFMKTAVSIGIIK